MSSLLEKASLIQVPSGYKDGTLYSQIPINGDGDFTFSRGSNLAATRVNSDGLIEKGTQNLLKYSGDLTQSQWQNVRTTDSTGHTGYDGTNDAFKIIPNTDNNTHRLDYVDTWATGQVYTFSFYAKEDGYNTIDIVIGDTTIGSDYGRFNLSTGTASNVGLSISTSMEDVGSGWYRCQVAQISGSTTRINIGINDGTTQSYAGDGTSGVLIQHPQLEQGLVATPYIETGASTAQAGILEDMPRLDYSGGATCPSLLLEPSRTNSIAHSEYFEASEWNYVNGVTRTANATLSPEGFENAYLITEDSSLAAHRIGQSAWNQSVANTSVSVFAKANGTSYIVLGNANMSPSMNTWFDLEGGVVGTQSPDITSASIEPFENGWYRCSISYLPNKGNTYPTIYLSDADGASLTYQGDGVSGVYLYGYQIEVNASYPTSYIPTYGASVTRNQDNTLNSSASSVIGQTEGAIYAEVDFKAISEESRFVQLSDGTNNNRFLVGSTATNGVQIYVVSAGAVQWTPATTPFSDGVIKVAVAYKNNDYAMYVNGTQISTTTSASVPAMDEISIGYNSIVGNRHTAYGHRKMMLFPTRLTNDELAQLTTL